jgi:lactoylglutathione lyase
MKIEHIAIWTRDLERLKAFYADYFDARAGEKYVNREKQFGSYFLLRRRRPAGVDVHAVHSASANDLSGSSPGSSTAFATGSGRERRPPDPRLSGTGYCDGPRRTGDGYYESVVFDRTAIASRSRCKTDAAGFRVRRAQRAAYRQQ